MEDAALLYQLLQGPDALDPLTLSHPVNDPLPGMKRGVRGMRLARLPENDSPAWNPIFFAAYEAALEVLRRAGAISIRCGCPADSTTTRS